MSPAMSKGGQANVFFVKFVKKNQKRNLDREKKLFWVGLIKMCDPQ